MAQLPADVSPGDSGHDDHHNALHALYNHLDTLGGGDATAFVIDEDGMSTDSATRPPSQQSVKAYVDANPQSVADIKAALLNDQLELTDLATLGNLADHVPFGGTTGQVLTKLSDTVADTAWVSPASGTVRNTHTHDSEGALSIARAGADQYTEVPISADATSWTNNLTTTGDGLHLILLGDGGSANYTVDLTALQGIDTTFDIFPDTEIEVSILKRGANLWAKFTILDAGTPFATFSVVDTGELAYNSATTFTIPTVEAGDTLLVAVGAAGSTDPGAATASLPAGALTQLYSNYPIDAAFRSRGTLLYRTLTVDDIGDTVTVSPGAEAESIGYAILRGITITTDSPAPVLNGGDESDGLVFPAITTANSGDIVFIHGTDQGTLVAADIATLSDGGFVALLTQMENSRGQFLAYKIQSTAGLVTPGTLKTTGDNFYDNWTTAAFVGVV